RKGRQGASMQDIADEAGINRTLLNYYFRSKDKLFDLIFENVFLRFIPDIAKLLVKEGPIEQKFDIFIKHYTSLLKRSPFTPIFILHELTTNPERLIASIKSRGVDPTSFLKLIRDEMDKGNIKKTDPVQLMVNLLSLVIFPFAARPMLLGMFFEGNNDKYNQFIEEREENLGEYFINSIK
ncbi:MAG: TetR/AcrR family transcriptional regulator, partial [Bacteroidales bacterium]